MKHVSDEVLSKILTSEQYAKVKHPTPYIFEVSDGQTALKYFGSRHSAEPKDPMFTRLHDEFVAFRPDVVFVEGLQSKRVNDKADALARSMTYNEAIERGGEAIYVVKLATEHNIEWRCPEPDDSDLYNHLLCQCGFGQSHIAAWHLLYLLPQWQRRNEEVNFKDYTCRFLELFQEKTGWSDFDYSYAYAVCIAEQVLGRRLKLENRMQAEEMVMPVKYQHRADEWTVFNRISQTASEYRDEYIVRKIGERLLEGGRVFVVYGASHAVKQESALKYLISPEL